ncbi:uncharacterized protein LOC126792386 [Argentina anserina]|uniref:uncharacterized protein LOC126792386 n=1 Tax=Argentina anserina TaxID=57926 RepID=UPI0021768080|nr:uncharacterized protein LOC126792386 [Potentilla anserina]
MASQLYSSVEALEGRNVLGEDVDVIDLTDVNEDDVEVCVLGRDVNVGCVNEPKVCPSGGTFGNLSDILGDEDLNMYDDDDDDDDDDDAIYGHDGKRIRREVVGDCGFYYKHTAHRPWPVGYKDQLAREIEEIEKKEREATEKRERKEIENWRIEEEIIRESQASVGLSRDEIEERVTEKEENEQKDREEQVARE